MPHIPTDDPLDSLIISAFEREVPPSQLKRVVDFSKGLTKNHPEVIAAAASIFAAGVFRIIARSLAGTVAVAGIGVGAYLFSTSAPEVAEPVPVVAAPATPAGETTRLFAPDGVISFTGGEGSEHINPLAASATTDEGTIGDWIVYDSDGAQILSGTGASTGDVLDSLAAGSYTMNWRITSDDGATARMQRPFVVQ